MFLKDLSAKSLQKAAQVLDAIGNGTLSLLEEGAYDLFYEIDPVSKTLFHSAILKESFLRKALEVFAPTSLCFGVGEDGYLLGEPNEYSAPLLFFLYEREKDLGEEEIEEIYGEGYKAIELTKGLSSFEAERKIALRKDFEAFLTKLSKVKEDKVEDSPKDRKYGARFHLRLDYFATMGLDVVTETGTHRIENLSRFVDAQLKNGAYKISSKESISLGPTSFPSPYDAAVNYFCNHAIFYGKYKVDMAEVATKSLYTLLEMLVGEEIYFQDKRILVEDCGPVSISIGKRGEPSFTPDLFTKNRIHLGEKGVLLIDEKKPSISYYPYGSETVRQTYNYFYQHQSENFEYIKDIFSSKLLPKVSSSLEKASAKGTSSPFLIRLYVSFDAQERLQFKSTYEENGSEVKKGEVKTEYGKSLLSAYEALLTSLGGLEHGHLDSQKAIYDFLTRDISPLTKLAQVYFEDRLKPGSLKRNVNLRINATYGQDYLSLTLDSPDYGEEEILAILNATRKKKKFVLLKDKAILLEDPNLEEAADIFSEEDGLVKLDAPLYQLFHLQNSEIKVNADKKSKEILEEIKDYRNAEVALPSSIKSLLRPYQEDGVKYLSTLSRYGLGGILADEMGLGKTLQAIAYLVGLEEEGPILIITPKAVLYNWLSEINRFSTLDAYILDGNKAKRDESIAKIPSTGKKVYLSSYDSFRRDSDEFAKKEFSVVILDEAQSVKNAFSQRHMALGKLKARHRFALTGTPLENSPLDLWSIFDFLMPGYLGGIDQFERFAILEDNRELLSALLKPFTLRRKKEDVLKDLPEKSEDNIILQMEESQRLYYVAFLQKARDEEYLEGDRMSLFAALTRLRQICVDPSNFIEEYDGVSSKLSYCRDMLLEARENGHKAIVFSSFKTALTHLEELLREEGMKVGVITGDTSGKNRLALANEFNKEDGEIEVMLVSLKAGGVGLNLIGADTVIHLDPWWNPAAENQASDRAHRIGQTKKVSVYRLICKDSIEEKVQLLQEKKKTLFEDLIEGSGGANRLTAEDIAFLLS